jgi:probable rRNA maturation factor
LAISQTSEGSKFFYKKFGPLKKWLDRVIENENFKTGEISIVFTSDEFLLSINREYLKHDYYTDVITFDYSTETIISGDILISVPRVKENAKLYNVEFIEELDRVILHGILHLLGYNDVNDQDISLMRSKETCYLMKR